MSLAAPSVPIPNGTGTLTSGVTGIVTVPAAPLQIGRGSFGVIIRGWVTITPGAGTTGIVIQLHQGTAVANPQIDQSISINGLVAGNTYIIPFQFIDTTNSLDVAGGSQYRLGIGQTGSPTAGGTCTGGEVTVEI